MTRDFDGSDLLVGEIAALRTFDLRSDGTLWPVFAANQPWVDGVNEASCPTHSPAGAQGCKCGFWAYGTPRALRDQPASRNVAAIVLCWGRVTPGGRGIRAQYARLHSIWLSPRVSKSLVAQVRANYPGATIYRDRARMLAQTPLTPLPSYVAETARVTPARVVRGIMRALFVAAIVVGLLPPSSFHGNALLSGLQHEVVIVLFSAAASAGIRILYNAARDPRGVRMFARIMVRVGALLLWVWAPYLPLWLQLVVRAPLLVWLARMLLVRTVRFIPTPAGRS